MSLPLGQTTTTTHDPSISSDICATPSKLCPSCHVRDCVCTCVHMHMCVVWVNLGPRRGEERRQWPRKWCIQWESRRQQGGGLLLQGAQMWSIMFIKSNDRSLLCWFFVGLNHWPSGLLFIKCFKLLKPLVRVLHNSSAVSGVETMYDTGCHKNSYRRKGAFVWQKQKY